MMSQSEREFLEELRRDFVLEAEEYLQTIVSGLLECERGSPSPKTLEEIFRAAHSLKGAAQAVRMPHISELCQIMESIFSGMKKGVLLLSAEGFDALQRTSGLLSDMIAGGEDGKGTGEVRKALEAVLAGEKTSEPASPSLFPSKEAWRSGSGEGAEESAISRTQERPKETAGAEPSAVPLTNSARETVRISAAKLDGLLLKAEELISINQAMAVRLGEIRDLRFLLSEWQEEWRKAGTGLKKSGAGNGLPRDVGEFLEKEGERLRLAADRAGAMEKALTAEGRSARGLVDALLEEARSVLMLPFSTLFQGFPKIVRDLARDLGKEAELSLSGAEIEVDKRILEGLKDPLIHLMRNSLDHGIETPGERRAGQKKERGTITLSVSSVERGWIEITLADDGKGIDPAMLREKAVKTGLLGTGDARLLSDEAALMLIFESGFSTSPIITDISGRGLGMAIVREGIERLGGKISLSSQPGEGTAFSLSLPVTLATFRGVLVEEWDRLFAIPTANVKRVARIRRSDVKTVENSEVVTLDGLPYALVRLGSLLEMSPPPGWGERDLLSVVAAGAGDSVLAFAVDRVAGEQEVLLKPLGGLLKRVRNVAGVTVLGSGRIVPVLHCGDLVKSAGKAPSREIRPAGREGQGKATVLVAEDSITSRTLLKNILTAAGYNVLTAVDGRDAWDILSGENVSALVSDVEMPRMNGFELTSRIRSADRLADIPVILVTSLESSEDRERGVEAGADAYIVKSGFDQGTLLDVLRRLI